MNENTHHKPSPQLGTTYIAKSKNTSAELTFKYDLNGHFVSFSVNETLNEEQTKWLFQTDVFPYSENRMSEWRKKYAESFTVKQYKTDFSFDNLWNIYNHKLAKQDAQKAFNKLTEDDKIKCFIGVFPYDKYLAKSKTAKAHLSRYINGRYFENEYGH